MVDHHTASDTFIKHMQNETKLRGGCPADWVRTSKPSSHGARKQICAQNCSQLFLILHASCVNTPISTNMCGALCEVLRVVCERAEPKAITEDAEHLAKIPCNQCVVSDVGH